MIKFFNTLSGKVEAFHPLQDQKVSLYACGPTVYDFAHIGNFRTFVFEDFLRRFFEWNGYDVKHVMNITDVDDKTIQGAAQSGQTLQQFTERFTQAFEEDLRSLQCLKPQVQPCATQEILPSQGLGMIQLIQTLVDKGFAYPSDGSVYFRVSKFPSYGKLSKKILEQNIQGARVDVDEYQKEDGSDFVLWKKTKPGEPSWDSPWGPGRPGWHIECSAMSMKYLGETFDLHVGGEDLIFPHHENEIAQSEAATGKPFVRYWLHCKFLLVNGEKMSKSKGNFYTLRDLIQKGYDPIGVRYALMSVHYRQPLNFTLESLQAAVKAVQTLNQFYSSVMNHEFFGRSFSTEHFLGAILKQTHADIYDALADDLNISKALASVFGFVDKVDKKIKASQISKADWEHLKDFLGGLQRLLGIFRDQSFEKIPESVRDLFFKRISLKKEKKFDDADKIRKEIEALGYLVWDEAKGVTGISK